MRVKMLFFASYRDIAGVNELTADLASGATAADAAEWLIDRYPGFAPALPKGRIAVDLQFVDTAHPLREGSEIAFMPPMSGG